MSDRAVAPVVGVPLLLAVTVALATVVGAGVVGTSATPGAPTQATFEASADTTGEIRVVHTGGDAIDPEDLALTVRVDGDLLAFQPPVPFFSARGFESGPTGVFNSATGGEWRAGEAASLRVADSNEPTLTAGATVTVRIYADDVGIAVLEVPVQDASTASPSPSVPAASSPEPPPSASSPATADSASGPEAVPASVSGT